MRLRHDHSGGGGCLGGAFHGEKATPLAAGVVIAIGNYGLYLGHWGVRVEDMVVVGPEGPLVLSHYPRQLEKQM